MTTIAWIIGIITVGHLIAYAVFVLWTTNIRPDDNTPPGEIINHTWDGDLREINNPSPRWILVLFYGMIGVAVVYLILFPGVWRGVLGWTQVGQYEEQSLKADMQEAEYFAFYDTKGVEELAENPQAVASGRRIFLQNCAVCHGSDAAGTPGSYPNLTDNDWLWGGEADKIVQTITNGRIGNMPANGALADPSEENLLAVANYVHELGGRDYDKALAEKGKALYNQSCIACHGADGTGNQLLGAPNLTDDIWLYSQDGTIDDIISQIVHPKNHVMPAWSENLGPQKIKVVAAYIYSLSHDPASASNN
ncbi:cytochrome-c oxidase, cbb3-type subunit III [Cardiobacteriaceae bacterium TAE3-ERU3]|nr:cytochrome-c oxidase, cbb3-type subunit III [Cardiobacteriaceae bacterium TAE3-ERU3]